MQRIPANSIKGLHMLQSFCSSFLSLSHLHRLMSFTDICLNVIIASGGLSLFLNI